MKMYGEMENVSMSARTLWNISHEWNGRNKCIKILKIKMHDVTDRSTLHEMYN
jgi:hypothetical protein